jgi:hypothetical protein
VGQSDAATKAALLILGGRTGFGIGRTGIGQTALRASRCGGSASEPRRGAVVLQGRNLREFSPRSLRVRQLGLPTDGVFLRTVSRQGDDGDFGNETECLVAPSERRHTDVLAGTPRSRDSGASGESEPPGVSRTATNAGTLTRPGRSLAEQEAQRNGMHGVSEGTAPAGGGTSCLFSWGGRAEENDKRRDLLRGAQRAMLRT